jgi:2-methylisocitrate lyase-like PEP mutase family enzyme
MTTRTEKVATFRVLHEAGCFVIPNAWDVGSARLIAAAGAKAVATTSSGYAWTQGKRDSEAMVSRDETIAYAGLIARNVACPVSADTEDCFDDPAETVRQAAEAGLSGLSIEDYNTAEGETRSFEEACERVAKAAEAARKANIVLTARADGIINKAYDLDEAIRRLKAFEALGPDVLFAPGIKALDDLRKLCAAVSKPVNHLASPGFAGRSLAEIAATGVRRISVGGTLTRAVGGKALELAKGLLAGDIAVLDGAPPWASIGGA